VVISSQPTFPLSNSSSGGFTHINRAYIHSCPQVIPTLGVKRVKTDIIPKKGSI
jgi:hypothetical protein